MIRNENKSIEEVIEQINDLTYDVMLLESELKGCEVVSLGMDLMDQLIEKRIKLAILKDCNGF